MRSLILFFLLFSFNIFAQPHLNVGLKEGINTSQISGDAYKGFHKSGFLGGAFVKITLKGEWNAFVEVMYTEKGGRHRSDYNKGDFNSYFLQLNYVEIPFLLEYKINRVGLQIGPGYGFLIKTKEITTIDGKDELNHKPFNQGEISFNFGLNYTFSSHFGCTLRATNSMVPIRKNPTFNNSVTNIGQLNGVLAICLTYEFGQDGSVWK